MTPSLAASDPIASNSHHSQSSSSSPNNSTSTTPSHQPHQHHNTSLWQKFQQIPPNTKINTTIAICLFFILAINLIHLKQLNETLKLPDELTGKRVLVTGAAGFIGSHLSKQLHKQGNLVVGLDSFNDYYDQELKRVRANQLTHQFDIDVIEGNVCDQELLTRLFEKHRFTHVAHLAAQAGVRFSLVNPQSYVTNNLMCLTNLLEVVRKVNPEVVFVYASSSSVYGRNKKIPFSEKDQVDHPSNVYGASKKANEAWALVYHELFGIKVTGLRFFTVYGPYGRPDMAIYLWANSIAKNEPLRLYEKKDAFGNAVELKRDFTYVSDIVDGIIGSLSLGAPHEVFNLGNNTPEPITRLIDYLGAALGRPQPKRALTPLPPADISVTYADISHAQRRLGFSPKTNLKDGVRKFVSWYRDYYYPSNLIMIFVSSDDDFKQWYGRRTQKKLPNCRHIIFHPKGALSHRVVSQYTQMDLRFREIEAQSEGGSKFVNRGQVARAYLAFVEQLIDSAPQSEWEVNRVAMFLGSGNAAETLTQNYDDTFAEPAIYSQTDRDLIYKGTSKAPESVAGCNNVLKKASTSLGPGYVSDEAIAGSARSVMKLFKYVLNSEKDVKCFGNGLNIAYTNVRGFSKDNNKILVR